MSEAKTRISQLDKCAKMEPKKIQSLLPFTSLKKALEII